MPKPGTLEKATLTELWPGSDNQLAERNKDGGPPRRVTVQFNPQTLKVTLSNQNAGGSQPGGSSTQFVGQGTTKLTLELWFDVTLPRPAGDDPGGDVRNLTREIAYFMTPQEVTRGSERGLLPPGVLFHWGTFLFKGTVDSMDETLELFSEDGKPLRAGVNLSLSKQDLKFEFGAAGKGANPAGLGRPGGGGFGGLPGAGTQPLQMARAGETVQAAAARAGIGDWKAVAVANGIENPRRVAPGALLDLSGTASAAGAARLGLTGATASAPATSASVASAGITATGSASGGLTASASLRFSGPAGAPR
jgi:Contractile injection system tube protein